MRRSITDALRRFEAESAVSTAKFEMQHQKLKQELVRKYGEDGVKKVDQKIEREWRKENDG